MHLLLLQALTISLVSSMKNVLLIGSATTEMLARLKENDVQVHKLSEKGKDWLRDNGDQISYVMTNGHDGMPSEYMIFLPNLKVISSNGVGYDGIDAMAAAAKNVLVTHTPHVLDAETSTTAIMLMLACYRNFRSCEQHARSGAWEKLGPHKLTRAADNRKVGLLGMGRIGQAIANKLVSFNCEVVYHTRSKRNDIMFQYYGSLVAMARDVDCLICIVPGGSETKHIVDEEVINALGPDGTLINVARGSVVDEQAMIKALQEGRLGWAGLDVYENEPFIPRDLRAMENVVLLPHVGSATIETRASMGALTVENILKHIKDGTVITPVPECAHLLQNA